MKFTVFTPTYNRAYIIENLYKSLCRQSFKDFEWIVVDDGSTDDTEKLFEKIKENENDFPITYIKTKNGGKHRAINVGLQAAKGEMFFIVDSDDYLLDNALETVDSVEKQIPEDQKKFFGGVCGCKGYSDSEIVGSTFDGEFIDITSLDRPKYNVEGDKAEVFYTEILKKYPFPEFEGEKFVTESVVWERIAHDGFKLRFFNKIIYICDYLSDGLSANYFRTLENNPRGYGVFVYQRCKFGFYTGTRKWKEYMIYCNAVKDKLELSEIAELLHKNKLMLQLELTVFNIVVKLKDRLK